MFKVQVLVIVPNSTYDFCQFFIYKFVILSYYHHGLDLHFFCGKKVGKATAIQGGEVSRKVQTTSVIILFNSYQAPVGLPGSALGAALIREC